MGSCGFVSRPPAVSSECTAVVAPHLVATNRFPRCWQGAVSSVEPGKLLPDGGSAAGGRITLADGQHVEYDWLVLALGSETSTFGIPGAKELATPFCTYIDALKVPH